MRKLEIRTICNGYILIQNGDEEFYPTVDDLFQGMLYILEDRMELPQTMDRYGKVTVSRVPPPSTSCPS